MQMNKEEICWMFSDVFTLASAIEKADDLKTVRQHATLLKLRTKQIYDFI
jgi:hypothetical protein